MREVYSNFDEETNEEKNFPTRIIKLRYFLTPLSFFFVCFFFLVETRALFFFSSSSSSSFSSTVHHSLYSLRKNCAPLSLSLSSLKKSKKEREKIVHETLILRKKN